MTLPDQRFAGGRRLGELLFVGFEGLEVDADLRSFLMELRPGGIILFQRNIAAEEQLVRLTEALHALYEPRPLVAVDEEGGQVSRLRSLSGTLPPAARLAALRDPGAVRGLAGSLGRLLAAAGFDLDFAPVADLCSPAAPNGIGDRSFGTDPELACAMAAAYLDGLADAGVLGCLKHFPGLGPTSADSHHHLPTADKSEEAFSREDLLPYRRLHLRAPVIMVAHGHYPFWAGADPVAATLTSRIVTELLRREIGYTGLALADDLEMKAVSERFPYRELAPRVIEAGCDMALVCRRRDAIHESLAGLESWLEQGRLGEGRIAEALSRLDSLRVKALATRSAAPVSAEAFRAARSDLGSRVEAIA